MASYSAAPKSVVKEMMITSRTMYLMRQIRDTFRSYTDYLHSNR